MRSFIQFSNCFERAQLCRLTVGTRCAAFYSRRALLLTDVHLGPFFSDTCLDRLLRQAAALRPDLVLLGGDYAENEALEELFFRRFSQALCPPLGTFAVMGNNDLENFGCDGARFCALARRYGVVPLINQTEEIRVEGGRMLVAGLDDLKHGHPAGPLFSGAREDDLCLLLAHYPHLAYTHLGECARKPDLMLCGHTHGGQFNILGLTPYSFWGFENLSFGRRMRLVSGLNTHEGVPVLVSNGIGTSRLPFRIGVPAQMHLIFFGEKSLPESEFTP